LAQNGSLSENRPPAFHARLSGVLSAEEAALAEMSVQAGELPSAARVVAFGSRERKKSIS